MPKENDILDFSNTHKTVVKSEDGILFAHTTHFDDAALERNHQIRLDGMLENAKLGLHDNEDIRAVVSCPSSLQWSAFKKKHHETYKLITSNQEIERMKGIKQLQILEPDWVLQTRY